MWKNLGTLETCRSGTRVAAASYPVAADCTAAHWTGVATGKEESTKKIRETINCSHRGRLKSWRFIANTVHTVRVFVRETASPRRRSHLFRGVTPPVSPSPPFSLLFASSRVEKRPPLMGLGAGARHHRRRRLRPHRGLRHHWGVARTPNQLCDEQEESRWRGRRSRWGCGPQQGRTHGGRESVQVRNREFELHIVWPEKVGGI